MFAVHSHSGGAFLVETHMFEGGEHWLRPPVLLAFFRPPCELNGRGSAAVRASAVSFKFKDQLCVRSLRMTSPINLSVHTLSGKTFHCEVLEEESIQHLAGRVSEQGGDSFDSEEFNLVFCGRILG